MSGGRRLLTPSPNIAYLKDPNIWPDMNQTQHETFGFKAKDEYLNKNKIQKDTVFFSAFNT